MVDSPHFFGGRTPQDLDITGDPWNENESPHSVVLSSAVVSVASLNLSVQETPDLVQLTRGELMRVTRGKAVDGYNPRGAERDLITNNILRFSLKCVDRIRWTWAGETRPLL